MKKLKIDKVYILHVKKGYEEREVHITQEMQKHGIDFEFILDYDIPDLNDEVIHKYYKKDHPLDAPNLSVGLKHISILKKILDNNYKRTMVFEDDVFLDTDFTTKLSQALHEVEEKKNYVISLGNAANHYTKKELIQEGQYLYENIKHRAADSYVLDYEAAKNRYEWFENNKTDQTAGWMYNYIDKDMGITIYWMSPTIVEQGSQNGLMDSSIQKHKPLSRLRWLWRDFNKQYFSKG